VKDNTPVGLYVIPLEVEVENIVVVLNLVNSVKSSIALPYS
jgi:hypothetical protein